MSNSGNTQTIHIIDGEEYVLLRDEERNKLVTPKDLLKYLLGMVNFRCYRKIKPSLLCCHSRSHQRGEPFRSRFAHQLVMKNPTN